MRDRTVQISSAGKTFSFTGWKIGWVCAQPALLETVRTAKQFLTFVNGAPFQHAIATALNLPLTDFEEFVADMRQKRDCLMSGLTAAGFKVLLLLELTSSLQISGRLEPLTEGFLHGTA